LMIMTVPCELAVRPVVFVDVLVTKRGFAMPSRLIENGFVIQPFCFVGAGRTKQSGPFRPSRASDRQAVQRTRRN
jgi:hypothetical protein